MNIGKGISNYFSVSKKSSIVLRYYLALLYFNSLNRLPEETFLIYCTNLHLAKLAHTLKWKFTVPAQK